MQLGQVTRMEILQCNEQNLKQHIMCNIPLFELNIDQLKKLEEEVSALTNGELELRFKGNKKSTGKKNKAFYDKNLKELIDFSGCSEFNDCNVSVNYDSEGNLQIDYGADFGEAVANLEDKVNENKSLIRNSLSLIKEIKWVANKQKEVYDFILNYQKDYIQTGHESVIKPLSMDDIGKKVGISVSTVSRLIKNNYVKFPDGNKMKLKCLIFNKDSLNRLKAYRVMGNLIKQGKYGLSDLKMAEHLKNEFGVDLSRRTVAKYRKEIKDYIGGKR